MRYFCTFPNGLVTQPARRAAIICLAMTIVFSAGWMNNRATAQYPLPSGYSEQQPGWDIAVENGNHQNMGSGSRQTLETGPTFDSPFKYYCGVSEYDFPEGADKVKWSHAQWIPWEINGPGEFLGPGRTPAIPDYRLGFNDEVEFVFQPNRIQTGQPYRLTIGDTIRVVSASDERLNVASQKDGITIMSDGTISLDIIGTVFAAGRTIDELQQDLDERYREFLDAEPRITVTGIQTDTRLRDFLASVDARAGSGGQARSARVAADGTLRLPVIGAVRVYGLTLDELEREVNGQFNEMVPGLMVSVVLTQQAPRFMYVMGEVDEPGRYPLTGPTTAIQAVALAGGYLNGGNLRQIVVLRRDHNWRLMAVQLDMNRGLNGRDPLPADDIWLRDSDVILIPKRPIVHLADAIELYFTRTLYALFPSELGMFDAQSFNVQ